MKEIRRCTRCVMSDAVDDTITFDEQGVCNYCTDALAIMPAMYFPNDEGKRRLEALVEELKKKGEGRDFDCVMGLSGGLDSSYLAYLGASQWGLRIAAVHIDDGYDTEISSENIRKLCEKTGIEFVRVSPDDEQFNALTLAYMMAGVPNLVIPQDNLLFAAVYDFAKEQQLSDFLSGSNFALESILQKGNSWPAYDVVNIKDIHKRFGEKPIDKLKFISDMQRVSDRWVHKLNTPKPLNYVDYNRDRAFAELEEYCGFQYYGRKHLENYLTAFLQLCWLPEKFGDDKRSSHLSSMIVSGQMTRDEAMEELAQPLYEEAYMDRVKQMICDKMDISRDELESLIHSEGHQHYEYKTDKLTGKVIKAGVKAVHVARVLKGKREPDRA